jgi:prepilin-type processing-associated H-X9-DG protein
LNIRELGKSPGDTHGYATPGWTEAFEVHRLGKSPPTADLDEPGNLAAFSEFGSSHPGVLNALFADGVVRTIRYSVSPAVWRRACVRNDNQNFSLNDL